MARDLTDLADERLALLVQQMADELGRTAGYQTEIAKRLGMTQPGVSQVLGGTKGAGLESIAGAIAYGLDPNWFFAEDLGPTPRFREHMKKSDARLERDDVPEIVVTYVKNHPGSERLLDIQWRRVAAELGAEMNDAFLMGQLALAVAAQGQVAEPPAPRGGRMHRAKRQT